MDAALMSAKIVNHDGQTIPISSLSGPNKVVGIYFSAHWCPPCRGFTPLLINCYKKLKEAGKDFEVIFVSSDRDAESFKSYFGDMPWLAVDFDDENKHELMGKYNVRGIPSFQLLDGATGEVKIADGRNTISQDLEGAKFPWI